MKISSKEMKLISCISNSLYDDLKIDFLYNSNHLEGSSFSKTDLDELLFEKKVCGEHLFNDVIVSKNSSKVFDMLIKSLYKELNVDMLFSFYKELKKGSIDEELNGFNLKSVQSVMVNDPLFNLLTDYNKIIKPNIEDITKFHYRFEYIHPFCDVNGLIGRFIILKQCIEVNIDLFYIEDVEKEEYINALYKAQKDDDFLDLLTFFKKCQRNIDVKYKDYKNMLNSIKEEVGGTL